MNQSIFIRAVEDELHYRHHHLQPIISSLSTGIRIGVCTGHGVDSEVDPVHLCPSELDRGRCIRDVVED